MNKLKPYRFITIGKSRFKIYFETMPNEKPAKRRLGRAE